MAGYSGTPLPAKLGIKAGATLLLLAAPPGFDETLGPLPPGVIIRRRGTGTADVVVCFITTRGSLVRQFTALAEAVYPAGGLWFAWPKRASGVTTDVTEDVIRDHAVAAGLVDNKVCAIDETWSGLRIVHRKESRHR